MCKIWMWLDVFPQRSTKTKVCSVCCLLWARSRMKQCVLTSNHQACSAVWLNEVSQRCDLFSLGATVIRVTSDNSRGRRCERSAASMVRRSHIRSNEHDPCPLRFGAQQGPRHLRQGPPERASLRPRVEQLRAMAAAGSAFSGAPSGVAWDTRAALMRDCHGSEQWLRDMAQRLQNKWETALGPAPAGTITHPGKSGASASRATSRDPQDESGRDPAQWAYRTVPEARRWVQALDTHPSFGDTRFLWYALGRPVMVRRLVY